MFTSGLDDGASSLRALDRKLYDRFGGLTASADLTRVKRTPIRITYAQRAAA